MNEKNILFISELKHIEEIAPFLSTHPNIQKEGYLTVPLDAEIEYVLIEKGIPFRSGREYRTNDTAPMTLVESWLETLFKSEQWSFFHYRGVSFSRLYFFPLQAYLTPLLYYADIVANVLTRHRSVVRIIAFPPVGSASSIGFFLEERRIKAFIDATACLAAQRGIEVLIPERTIPIRTRTSVTSFWVRRMLFGFGIGFVNVLVTLLRRPRRMRILASDYWDNLVPYLNNLDSAEVFLLDRIQALSAGFSNIWKFRMRFVHLDAYAAKSSFEREQERDRITRAWHTVQHSSGIPEFLFRGFSLQPLVVQALDIIIADVTSRILKDIDDAYMLLARVKPDVVELRSTMSVQTHFVILAQVARSLGIPSLEMQHGIEYYGPGSLDRRHSAEHMGVYGPLIQEELRSAEDTITTHVIGSPRFDVYAHTAQSVSHRGVTVLCISPPISPGIAIDTYDIEEYFSTIAAAVREIPDASVIIKLRSGLFHQSFYETAIACIFKGIPHRVAQNEPLAGLYPLADIVVSNYSTATLEALQCGKPLLYFGVSPSFNLMAERHLAPYEREGALKVVKTKEELAHALRMLAHNPQARERMSQAAAAFLKKEFAFDGRASERAAELITSLASLKPR